jgi:DNA-binding NtrC family response regulator
MNPARLSRESVESNFMQKSATRIHETPGRPTVLIATIDPEIRERLTDLLESAGINAIWVDSVEEVKTLIVRKRIVACLCGFWLEDGTYREVIRHLRHERLDIRTIIVSAPAYPNKYRDYIAAMNLGALDFLCYPYQQSDFKRILDSAIAAHSRSTHPQVSENEHDLDERGAD